MSMVVQHNMQAANANRMLGITSGAQAKSTEKLSSGYKINRAADDAAVKSSLLTVVRTMILFVPLGYLFSRLGLNYFWFTFPVTEVLTTLVGVFFYRRFMAQQK